MTETKIQTCIVGAGFGKRVILPVCEMHPSLEVTSLVVKERIPTDVPKHVQVYVDLEQALRDSQAELVIIASPPLAHNEQVAMALQHGKHVFCEKPLAMDALSARLLEERCTRQGVVGGIDYSFRFIPARAYFIDLVRAGNIGTLQASYISFFRNDFNSWPSRWYYDRNQGGGMLQATGSHLLDTATSLLGCPIRWIEAVIKENDGIDTGFSLVLEVQGGSICIIAVSHTSPGLGKHLVEAHGTKGSLYLDEKGSILLVMGGVSSICPIPERYFYGFSDRKWDANPRMQPIARIISAMVTAIQGGSILSDMDFHAAVENQKMIDAAWRSHRTGRRVYLDGTK